MDSSLVAPNSGFGENVSHVEQYPVVTQSLLAKVFIGRSFPHSRDLDFWSGFDAHRNVAGPPLVPRQLFAAGTRAIDSAWASN
jgi:hypothetical protein